MTARRLWMLPTGLVLLALVPSLAGGLRLAELSGGGPVTPGNARFFDLPLPVVAHIVGAVVYALLGAFQFVPSLRRGSWHRRAGRVLVPAGLTVALSGIWMALAYDMPASDDGLPMTIMRVGVGGVMAFAIGYAVVAVRRRDFATHRAWMIRAYALAMGAGTQAFTHIPFAVAGVTPDDTGRFAAMAAGWAINAAVAEWAIRRS
ncbi:DUF2306 domain-containing protein [Herbidospora daliensis]|uniref:DUF2306 domain-containing protein n=1 Tax=Herbidospora daliensis TaxID=295585 RepID=UPI0007822E1B|nr:DUF2306 domain-containing protein [Herbidospora daliensis]